MFRQGRRRLRNLHQEAGICLYAAIAVQKMRLKWALFCHFIIFVLMVLRSLPAFITELGYKSSVELPEVQVWEILWFLSTVTSVSICFTLRRRRIGLLRIVIAGIVVFGLAPVMCGFYINLSHIRQYLEMRRQSNVSIRVFSAVMVEKIDCPHHTTCYNLSSFPILWYFWMLIALETHTFQIGFAFQLIDSWVCLSGQQAFTNIYWTTRKSIQSTLL